MSIKPLCCCEIYTLHAELIHHQGEIQYSQIPFTAADWRGLNYLNVIQSGITGLNEIGPHAMPLGMGYSVTVFQNLPSNIIKQVNLTILIDETTGIITLWKSGITPAFSGRVEVR
jgi:hypothetical protein